jgi:hypothetical protein
MDVMENILLDPELVSSLENHRKKALLLFVIDIVLASLIGLIGFFLIPISLILDGLSELAKGLLVALGFLLFLGGTPVFVFLAIHVKNSYLKEFEDAFSSRFAEGHYEDFRFAFKKDLTELEKIVALPLTEKPDSDHASFYEGKVEGLPFFSFSYCHMKASKGHPDSAAGRYIELTLPASNNPEILIQARKGKKMLKLASLKDRFETESIAFNETHEMSASSHEDALKIITPAFLDGLNVLDGEYGGHLSLYLKGNKLVLYFDDYPSFALNLTTVTTEKALEGFRKEVLLPYRVITALHLEA